MLNSLKTFLSIIRLYKNWEDVIADRLGLKKGEYVCELREGTYFKVRAGEKDINIINEIFISRSYHTALDTLRRNSTVIDIGGHIGTFSVICGKISKNGKIYSYEPFPSSYKLLKENLGLNKLSNVKAYEMSVVGTNMDYVDLGVKAIGQDFAGNSIYGTDNKITTKATNLTNIFQMNKIISCDLLKIDCEGAEYDIILNTPKKLFNIVRNIVLEYHTPYGDPKKLRSYLESCGFKVIEDSKGVYFASKTP